MKVLSFSLYGNNPIYTIGTIKNARLKQIIFPDWEMWVYYNSTVPKEIIKELSSYDKVKLMFKRQEIKVRKIPLIKN